MNQCIGLILAAGKGTRMRSELPKPLVPFMGESLVAHISKAMKKANVNPVALVVGHGADLVKESMGATYVYVMQEQQNGTGHAVMQSENILDWKDKDILVFVGDSPLITPQTITQLIKHHQESKASCTFLTAHFDIHLPYARVIRDANGNFLDCIEEKNVNSEQFKIQEYLSSHFIFKANDLFPALHAILPDTKNGEYYLTDVIGILKNQNKSIEVCKISHYQELVGFNTPEDIAWGEKYIHNLNK